MLKLRETPEPTLRVVHICTICTKPIHPMDETTTAFEVTYHTACLTGVDMSASEEALTDPATEN
jgi:hypothetical protein